MAGGLSSEHPWAFAFGILGNIISFMVYLAPLPTFMRVYEKKSTQGFQSVPYAVALFSATLWIFYALLKTDACLLITINAVGCIIETAYILVYFIYAPRKAKMFTAKLVVLLNVVVFGLIVFCTLISAKGPRRVVLLGWICMIFSVSVFVAPLSIIRLVIRTKSVEFMPFFLSFFLTLSAVVWFGYGLVTEDMYVALPNVLGFLFGVLQMVLYIAYKDRKAEVIAEHKLSSEHAVTIAEIDEPGRESNDIEMVENMDSGDREGEGEGGERDGGEKKAEEAAQKGLNNSEHIVRDEGEADDIEKGRASGEMKNDIIN